MDKKQCGRVRIACYIADVGVQALAACAPKSYALGRLKARHQPGEQFNIANCQLRSCGRTGAIKSLIVLAVLLAMPCSTGWAQGNLEGGQHYAKDVINDLADSHLLSAHINSSTIGVGEIDFDAIDLDTLVPIVEDLGGKDPDMGRLVRQVHAVLVSAHVEKVYWIGKSPELLTGSPLFWIPTAHPANLRDSLGKVLWYPVRIEAKGNGVLIGSVATIVDQLGATVSSRPDLIAPLRRADRMPNTLVLSLSDNMRQVMALFWPEEPLGDFPASISPRELLLATKQIVLTFELPPASQFRMSIQTVDEQAAKRVESAVGDLAKQYNDVLGSIAIKQQHSEVVLTAGQELVVQLLRLVREARIRRQQEKVSDGMWRIRHFIFQYESQHGHLPPRCFVDRDGKELHSWVVALLPSLHAEALYERIKLDRAWDDEANQEALNTSLPHLMFPPGESIESTVLRAPVFPGSIWHGNGPPKKLSDVKDDAGETILLVEASRDAAIHWADPTPWTLSLDTLVEDVFGERKSAQFLMLDGSVRLIEKDELTNEQLATLFTIDGDD